MFTSILLFIVPNVLPVDELIGSSMLLFTTLDSLPIDKLLASTVTSAVTASEFFLLLFDTCGVSEMLRFLEFLDCPETLLFCLAFSALS